MRNHLPQGFKRFLPEVPMFTDENVLQTGASMLARAAKSPRRASAIANLGRAKRNYYWKTMFPQQFSPKREKNE